MYVLFCVSGRALTNVAKLYEIKKPAWEQTKSYAEICNAGFVQLE